MKGNLGIEFENELCEVCRVNLGNEYLKATEIQDKFESTDCFCLKMRVDFTYNFSNKSYMMVLPEEFKSKGETFRFGIRFSNGHGQFEEPVLVVGIDSDDNYVRSYMDEIVSVFRDKFDEIFELGFSQYWDCLDALA